MNKSRKPRGSLAVARVRRLLDTGAARELRIRAGLSLAAVGADVGAAASTIFCWENGQHAPHGDLAVRYLRFLERLERELDG